MCVLLVYDDCNSDEIKPDFKTNVYINVCTSKGINHTKSSIIKYKYCMYCKSEMHTNLVSPKE